MKFENYAKELDWTEEQFNKIRKSIQNLYRQNITQESLDIQSCTLPDNVREAVTNCFIVKKDTMYQAFVRKALLKKGYNIIENIDWKLKWILGSSDLASLREPLLQVDLYAVKNNSDRAERSIINFEANLKQVDSMIKELVKIKQELAV